MITATPTSYEIYDESELLAKIQMFDEGASNVEIRTIVDSQSWVILSKAILEALQVMHPVKEKNQ